MGGPGGAGQGDGVWAATGSWLRPPPTKDQGLALVLPDDSATLDVPAENVLHVLVQPGGVVEVRRGDSPRLQRVGPREVESIWRQEAAANPRLIASVRTHPDAAYGLMVEVLDALTVAGARRVSLQLLEPWGSGRSIRGRSAVRPPPPALRPRSARGGPPPR